MDRAAADLNGRSYPIRLTAARLWEGEIRVDDGEVTGRLATLGVRPAVLSGSVADWVAKLDSPSSLRELKDLVMDGSVAAGAITMRLDDLELWCQFRGDRIGEAALFDGRKRVRDVSLDLTAFLRDLGTAMRGRS